MKAVVGFLFFMLFLAGFAFVMLQGRQMAESNLPAGGAGIAGTSWRPVILGAGTVPDDSGMFVRFTVDGAVNGNGGCNSFFGSFEKTAAGVVIGELGATRMACPEPIMTRETAFIEALQNARQFRTGTDGLELLDGDDELLARLVPASGM